MKRKLEIIFKVLLGVLIASWIFIVFYDYSRSMNGKNPKFCIKSETHEYSDGNTYECVGLGYKMFRYNRNFSGVDFGGFWKKEKTSVK